MPSNALSRYTTWLVLAVILVIGLELRLQAVQYTEVDHSIRHDAKDYIVYAYNLKYLNVYSKTFSKKTALPAPDALRPPGYPLFLSLILDETISNKSLATVLYVQVILSTLLILLAYATFTTLLGDKLALVVALLTALSPHLISVNVYYLSETLFAFLLMSFLWLVSQLKSPPQQFTLLALGATLAAASLTRPWLQYFIILLLPLVSTRNARIYFATAFFAVMSLWIFRNIVTLGMISDSETMITSIYHGMYPGFMFDNQPESYGYPYRFDPRAQEISASSYSVIKEIIRRFTDYPVEHLQWYLVGKPVSLFSWNIIQGMGDVFIYAVKRSPYFEFTHFEISHEIMRFVHSPLIAFSMIGSALAWAPKRLLRLGEHSLFVVRCISLLIGYFILIHMIAAPFPRYAIPMLPILYGMAFFGGTQLFYWLKAKYDGAIALRRT